MNDFHGLEEMLPKPDYSNLFTEALKELEQERNKNIRESIKGIVEELKKVESDLKVLTKRKSKLEGRLKGYSLGQVQDVQEGG